MSDSLPERKESVVSSGDISAAASVTGDSEETKLKKRAETLGIPFLEVPPKKIERAVIGYIPEDAASKYRMVVYVKEGDILRVAMTDPEDFEALNILRFLAEKEQKSIEISLASDASVTEMLKQYTGTDRALKEAIRSLKSDGNLETGVSLTNESESEKESSKEDREVLQDAPIARLVESIVKHAIEARASDIHIEPAEENYRVRFRVDGLLHSSLVFPSQIGRAVIARIKILSNLKIDEKRKPQDGRFRAEHEGGAVDLRISTLPVVNGEKVVMRILDKKDNIVDFKQMGLWGRTGEVLRKKISDPYGIILMTGPTGSGKSTTLYSFLQILNQDERNIITLEDPVEYSIQGINQSQVKPEIGYTFANGLRSILRQDPNVIMVGEIRDAETAELAIHSALTGHLVLSTLHTNNAIGSIPRFVDMGIEPFLIASAVQVVAAQRLVRRVCPDCSEEVEITPTLRKRLQQSVESIDLEEMERYGHDPSKGIHLFQGKGCDSCGKTGYKGRIAIYEAFELTEEVKRIVIDDRANEGKLQEEAKRQKMLTMRQDGVLKAFCGMTTLAEVERVTEGDVLVDEE
ncbi:MAG: type II/IV secretion system protein [Candidatus Moranbacteria bacterium]|nr:type II/IV secretion system protein [Candidatus Moranbacteria bacterium]